MKPKAVDRAAISLKRAKTVSSQSNALSKQIRKMLASIEGVPEEIVTDRLIISNDDGTSSFIKTNMWFDHNGDLFVRVNFRGNIEG